MNNNDYLQYRQLLITAKILLKVKLQKIKEIDIIIPFKQFYLAKDLFDLDMFFLKPGDEVKSLDTLNNIYLFNVKIDLENNKHFISMKLKINNEYNVDKNYLYPFLSRYLEKSLLDKLFQSYNKIAEDLHKEYWEY